MTLEQQIGQMLWFGWQDESPEAALTVSPHARALLEEFQVGGIILMGRNIRDARQVAGLTNALQAGAALPLFTGIDQEGGAVVRLPLPGLTFPGNMALGALDDAEAATSVAAVIGEQLVAMGLNVDFAPVLDVNNNPANPVIGVRSFGEDPARVARLGVAALRGFAATGVIACVKHFPGHGDTAVDSHFDLPVQAAPRERLDVVELAPFRAAVAAGVPMVMTAHIRFTALDADRPATLSPAVLTNLLRREIGFGGIIVTDCLEMHGISHHFGVEEAALMAVEAGADCLLACHTLETQRCIHGALLAACRSGRLSSERIAASVERIMALKRASGLAERRVADPERAAAVVGAPGFRALERHLARRAITVVADEHGWLPLSPGPIRVGGAAGIVPGLVAELRAAGFDASAWSADNHEGSGGPPIILAVLPGDPTDRDWRERARRWLADGTRVLVVAVREPYPLAEYDGAPCRLATYGHWDGCLAALAEILAGRARPEGRLPVTLVAD